MDEMTRREDVLRGSQPEEPEARPIGREQVIELSRILADYRAGKQRTDDRIVAAESWWKMRNTAEERRETEIGRDGGYTARSAWLHNVITSKHADAMESYPMPDILPREEGDRQEARSLSAIVPCVLEQNDFEKTWSDVMWAKQKFGTGIYKVVWDAGKLHGLGDVAVEEVNPLNVFPEPGVRDIQRGQYFFHCEPAAKDALMEQYPFLTERALADTFVAQRFLYDDAVRTDDKVTVIEAYYHKNGRLHYCKFVGYTVLFATENERVRTATDPVTGQPVTEGFDYAGRGLYDHGKYPYVFDPLFPIEGSPYGYGYIDIDKSPQTTIDLINTALVKSAMVGAIPRFFKRQDAGVNSADLLDTSKAIVEVNGPIGEDAIRPIPTNSVDDLWVGFLDRQIQELRQTSGNTETSTGNTSAGVTAASAIAALQEASGKGSRDATRASYRAYREVVGLVIELIRQFYDAKRQFRIVGRGGQEQFIQYSNEGLRPQYQGVDFGIDMGYRVPEFDISVRAERENVYTRLTQNELALQFYSLGFFSPQQTDQALAAIQMMEFEGKGEVQQRIAQNGTMYQKLVQYMQLALSLSMQHQPELVPGLSQDIMQTTGGVSAAGAARIMPAAGESDGSGPTAAGQDEPAHVRSARERSRRASAPEGGGAV